MNWSVFDVYGCRKYLNRSEIRDFLNSTEEATSDIHAFCRLLAETGCRISEALSITPGRIDMSGPTIIFESLKKRRKGIFRRVPISPGLARLLTEISGSNGSQIWTWSRTTAWRHVHNHLVDAKVKGPQACPRGLRHGFAVAALGAGAPLNLVQAWLGHSNIETTSLYAVAVGPEEREIVERIWSRVRSETSRMEQDAPFLNGTHSSPVRHRSSRNMRAKSGSSGTPRAPDSYFQ
jgi:integrase